MDRAFKEQIEKIEACQETIATLLNSSSISLGEDDFGKWSIHELHHDNLCNVGFVTSSSTNLATFPLHRHPNSKEFLICVKGKAVLNIIGASRLLQAGDCAAIPLGVGHFTVPLERETKLIYVCVPNDSNFKEDLCRQGN